MGSSTVLTPWAVESCWAGACHIGICSSSTIVTCWMLNILNKDHTSNILRSSVIIKGKLPIRFHLTILQYYIVWITGIFKSFNLYELFLLFLNSVFSFLFPIQSLFPFFFLSLFSFLLSLTWCTLQAVTGADLQPCPAGTYNPVSGLANVSQCTQCDGGKYCQVPGLSAVSGNCNPGFFCTSGQFLKHYPNFLMN